MREPPDLRELIDDDLPPEELERLSRVDGLLRSVPGPPHDVPATLTQAVAEVPLAGRGPRRRRVAVALAFAALLIAASFLASQFVRRMQPLEWVLLTLAGSGVPWMP